MVGRILGGQARNIRQINSQLRRNEVERIINSRPITYIYDDREAISYALTPSHLMNGRSISTIPSSQHYDVISCTNQTLTRISRHQIEPSKWKRDYLLSLRENHKVKSRHVKKILIYL
jgi:hypothetical protein